MKKLSAILVISIILISGCYRDVEEELYPGNGNSGCDTTGVTYSNAIISILQSNGCLSCHSGGAPSGGISLQTYNTVKIVALDGRLYGTISHSAGYPQMPKGGNKMSACNISKLKAWIDAGAPNN